MYLHILIACFVSSVCRANGYFHSSRDSHSPPIPYHGVFSNNKGKTPLVAATYYFNSEPDLKREFIKEAVYADAPDTPEENPSIGSTVSKNDGYCEAADGRKGSCYDAQECVNRGGMPMGRCDSGGTKRDGTVCCLCEYIHYSRDVRTRFSAIRLSYRIQIVILRLLFCDLHNS